MRHSIHNILAFNLKGDGKLFDYLAFQFNYFKNDAFGEIPAFDVCVTDKINIDSQSVLKDKTVEYKRFNDDFIIDYKNSKCILNGTASLSKQKSLYFSKSFNKMKASALTDLMFRFAMIQHNIALVHASCVSKQQRSLLMPAWKGTGKTAICLKMVESGHDYMADDRLWLSSKGKTYAYPRYVVLKDNNLTHFSNTIDRKTKLKLYLKNKSNKIIRNQSSRVFRLINSRFLHIRPIHLHVETLFPDARVENEAQLSTVVFMQKSKQATRHSIDMANPEYIANIVYNIGNYEWNNDLLSMSAAHDVLFPESPKWHDKLLSLIAREKEVIINGLSKRSCKILTLPDKDENIFWGSIVSDLVKL